MALQTWRWKDPIYGMPYLLHLGSFDEAQRYLQRKVNKDPEKDDEHVIALTSLISAERETFLHLWFPEFSRRKNRHLATLAHEAVHAATITFNVVGMPIDEAHDEAAAYYVGWVYEECLKRLGRAR